MNPGGGGGYFATCGYQALWRKLGDRLQGEICVRQTQGVKRAAFRLSSNCKNP